MIKRFNIQADRLTGHLMFLVLFVLAALFYLERTVFLDPCYAIFNVLYYRDYITEAERYTAVLPQTLALGAMYLNLPLKMVLMLYSLSFILLYYIVYLIITYLFRLERIALAIPLLLVTGVKYSFYWISTETHQALVYTIFLFSFLKWSGSLEPGWRTLIIRIIAGTGIIMLGFYAHPIAFFTIIFTLAYIIIDEQSWKKPDLYLLAAAAFILALIKYLTSSSTGYEGIFFSGFGDFFTRLGNLSDSASLHFFNLKLFNIYLFPLIIAIITLIWYILKRQYLKLAIYITALSLFLLIIFTTFNIPFRHFIQEKNIMGLNVFLLIPFLNEITPGNKQGNRLMLLFLTVMFLAGTIHVIAGSTFHTERQNYIRKLITVARELPEKKFILNENLVDQETLSVNWGLATESLILSSLDSPDSSVTIYINDAFGKLESDLDLSDTTLLICTPWFQDLSTSPLDKKYFNLDHSGYRFLRAEDFTCGPIHLFFREKYTNYSPKGKNETCLTDTTGNRYLHTSQEFTGFYTGDYEQITQKPAALMTATLRVRPGEAIPAGSLSLVATRQRDQQIFTYYTSRDHQTETIPPHQWINLTVSGAFYAKDRETQLHFYLWNPGKSEVDIDDVQISWQWMR